MNWWYRNEELVIATLVCLGICAVLLGLLFYVLDAEERYCKSQGYDGYVYRRYSDDICYRRVDVQFIEVPVWKVKVLERK